MPPTDFRRCSCVLAVTVFMLLKFLLLDANACQGKDSESSGLNAVAAAARLGAPIDDVGDLKCLPIGDPDSADHETPENHEDPRCQLYQPPSKLVQLVMNMVVGAPNQGRCANFRDGCATKAPYDEKLRQFGDDWPPFGYTMIGKQRLEQFRASIHEVDRNGIEGCIIEAGVWRGGAMIMAAAVASESNFEQRDLYLYDAFDSIPGYGRSKSFLENSEDEVKGYFKLFGMLDHNVKFVKGMFKDTVPEWQKGTPIAVLRVDGNFYDSYADVLYSMYEDVPVGGIVIFDDVISHPHVMRCWTDFKRDQNLKEDLVRIDKVSAWFRKIEDVKVDQSKRLPPQDANKSQ